MKICHIMTTQYLMTPLQNWLDYEIKLEKLIIEAKEENADLLLLPEYAALEFKVNANQAVKEHFSILDKIVEKYCVFFSKMAQQYQIYLQPGTIPVKSNSDLFRNRAYFFQPDGKIGYQDKIRLTKFEKSLQCLEKGETLQIFNTHFGKMAIAICYDAEFPDYVSRLTKAGVKLLLVPSCTELAGFYRVHLSCRARAIENQIFVINAACAAPCEGSFVVDELTIGAGGGFAPANEPFPEDGVLKQGELGKPENIKVTLDFNQLEECFHIGSVTNFRDSDESLPKEMVLS